MSERWVVSHDSGSYRAWCHYRKAWRWVGGKCKPVYYWGGSGEPITDEWRTGAIAANEKKWRIFGEG